MPVITRLVEQRRSPNRRSVFIDGRFAFALSLNVVARFRLREGMTLTDQQVVQIRDGEARQECMDAALAFLGRRLHSRAELERKLGRAGYAPQAIQDVLAELERLGYLDDARFARTRALSAAQHRHHGRQRAFLELIKAGVSREVADRALDEVYGQANGLEVARQLALKQAARLRRLDPRVARRRLAGMLQRRGFDYETVRHIVDQALGGGEPD